MIIQKIQKVLNESKQKSNKIWVDKGNELYNRLMKSSLEKNAIEMDSTHNGEKSVVVERFIRTLRNKSDDDEEDELFLWYGWPTKGV